MFYVYLINYNYTDIELTGLLKIRKATMSSSYHTLKFPAENAIDGDNSTFLHTYGGTGQWLKVWLYGKNRISRVTVVNRNTFSHRIKGARVLLHYGEDIITQSEPIQLTNSNLVVIDFSNQMATKVEVAQMSNKSLNIAEVYVEGTDQQYCKSCMFFQ